MNVFRASVFFIFFLDLFQLNKDILLRLGTTKCIIHVYEKRRNAITVIRLHGNENTCIRAFFDLPSHKPFVLYQLSQSGKRLLKYKERGRIYFFDPNRMFSKNGIGKTLKKYNRHYPKSLVNKIYLFSQKVLIIAEIKPSKHVIAIHNNSNGKFSVKTYPQYSTISRVFISPSKDPDDFFIVTREVDFKFFKKHGENVVLQSKYARDDGSLSIYCQGHHIPYINVEAQYGHIQHQKKMLLLCEKLLSAP